MPYTACAMWCMWHVSSACRLVVRPSPPSPLQQCTWLAGQLRKLYQWPATAKGGGGNGATPRLLTQVNNARQLSRERGVCVQTSRMSRSLAGHKHVTQHPASSGPRAAEVLCVRWTDVQQREPSSVGKGHDLQVPSVPTSNLSCWAADQRGRCRDLQADGGSITCVLVCAYSGRLGIRSLFFCTVHTLLPHSAHMQPHPPSGYSICVLPSKYLLISRVVE